MGLTWKLEAGWQLSQQTNADTDEETEAERGRICPVLQLHQVAGLGAEPRPFGSWGLPMRDVALQCKADLTRQAT